MTDTFLPPYKKRSSIFEEFSKNNDHEDSVTISLKKKGFSVQAVTTMTQPLVDSNLLIQHYMSSANPLTQLADISLAMNHFLPSASGNQAEDEVSSTTPDFQASLAKLFWPTFFKLNMARENTTPFAHPTSMITPSSSPSPPPAHTSPIKQQTIGPAYHPDEALIGARQRLIMDPVQNAPEDLRIACKKLEFPSPNNSISNNTSSSNEDSMSDTSSLAGSSQTHQASSRTKDNYPCPECGKAYSTSSNLARHRQTHRSLQDKKARKCPHCEKTYVSMPAYSMHIRTHNLGCKCPFCGKCFSRPWLLQGHIRTHTGEKPFECKICSKAFADKSNLRAHTQTHSNTKPYVCQKCNKAFALKSYLYKHEESSCLRAFKQGLKEQRRKSREMKMTAK